MRLTIDNKKEVIKLIDHGETQNDIAKKFKVSQPAISKILSNRNLIESFDLNDLDDQGKRIDKVSVPIRIMERKLLLLLDEYNCMNIPISSSNLRMLAKELFNETNKEQFNASAGWFSGFLTRYKLSLKRISGESDAVNLSIVNDWLASLPDLTQGYEPKDWFNCDETALFYKQLPIYTVSKVGSRAHGIKIYKNRLSILFTVSAVGERLKPLIINNVNRPRCFKRINFDLTRLDSIYTSNERGWMTSEIFQSWINDLNNSFAQDNRQIILFLDGFSGHKVQNELSNIKIIFFPPNTTSVIQPLDAGVIKSFKTIYKNTLNEMLITKVKSKQDTDEGKNISQSFLKSFDILDAINLISDSWKTVKEETIVNCWSHTKLISK